MNNRSLTCFAMLAIAIFNFFGGKIFADDFDSTTEIVGRQINSFETPVNQLVTPAGMFVELPGTRPNALALSPNGKILVTAGMTHHLIVLDPATGKILQRVPFPTGNAKAQKPVAEDILNPDNRAQLSFTGLKFSPDGSRIYLSNVNGDIKVFSVGADNKIAPLFSIPLPPANVRGRKAEIPAGIAVSPDGKKIYVAGNLSNRLLELDATTGTVLKTWDVGIAPFDVVLCKNKIYVSNWGGRRPDTNSVTGPSGVGTRVRVDARSIADEGSVSVIGLDAKSEIRNPKSEILTGLRASAMALSPNRRWLVVANSGSDTLSVLDTHDDKIIETICARENPGDLFGAQPNAIAFDKSDKKLFVCNGTQNAVAVFQFKPGESKLLGLIPVGWFPGAIAFDAKRNQICVANIKDFGPGAAGKNGRRKFNSRQFYGSLSLVPVPSKNELKTLTETARADLRYPLLERAKLPPRENQAAVPVPERVGEPSVFAHVIYIIKENRAYDQVLGDVTEGNGDADLCIFGERITPNEHKIVRDFTLMDNMYCSGILSADGHQWADSAMGTDYLERQFAGWPRSYPAGGSGDSGSDALAYSPAGFIWNDALEHGKTLRDFGEFTSPICRWKNPGHKHAPKFLDTYRDFTGGSNEIIYASEPDLEALRPYIVTNTMGWDLNVPDIFRAAQFINNLKNCERTGNFPNLTIIWLPNDHTSGTNPGAPTPGAQAADNDLAMGQIFDAVSHSKFWKNTCIFAIEDDPQAGWDHVSGYRTTAYVASAYTKRRAVVHTQYNQTSLLRTIELILGLPPMNELDATATPMFDCFTNEPDFAPFDSVKNNIPLDQMNPEPKKISDLQLRKDAYVSAKLPLEKEDQCPEDLFNHILWRAMKGSKTPYPDWAVKITGDED